MTEKDKIRGDERIRGEKERKLLSSVERKRMSDEESSSLQTGN